LQGIDQGTASIAALESSKLLCGDDDNLIATVNRHMLRSFAAHLSNELAESGFRVL